MTVSDWVIATLTGVLIIITGFYAWETHRIVNEMRASRKLTILPKLALDFHMVGPTYAIVQVKNEGQGAALDVAFDLTFEGKSPDHTERRPWRANVMAPGERLRSCCHATATTTS